MFFYVTLAPYFRQIDNNKEGGVLDKDVGNGLKYGIFLTPRYRMMTAISETQLTAFDNLTAIKYILAQEMIEPKNFGRFEMRVAVNNQPDNFVIGTKRGTPKIYYSLDSMLDSLLELCPKYIDAQGEKNLSAIYVHVHTSEIRNEKTV